MSAPNIFDMSDEDFAKLVPGSSEYDQIMSAESDPNTDPDENENDDPNNADNTQVTNENEPPLIENQPDQNKGAEDKEGGEAPPIETVKTTKATPGTVPADPAEGQNTNKSAPNQSETAKAEIDYASAGQRILAPFKANGREIQVKSVDDAVALMQMGANYTAKMAGLKPNLATLKLLEKNGLNDPDKINYLIDLYQKNPQAITNLVKDSGINPMDLDTEKDSLYSPTQRSVSEAEMEMEAVLEELKPEPHYNDLIQTVGIKWDEASREVLAKHPNLLRILSGNMERGVFNQIQAQVEYERQMGRLNGFSDLEAYRQVGDAMQAQNMFTGMQEQKPQTPAPAPATTTVRVPVVKSNPSTTVDPQTAARRKAASSTSATPGAAKQNINPLELSDEEFQKIGGINYITRN